MIYDVFVKCLFNFKTLPYHRCHIKMSAAVAAAAARERCPGRHGRGDGEMKKVLSAFYYCIYTRSVRARVLFLYEINFNFNNFRAKKIIKTALVSPRHRRRPSAVSLSSSCPPLRSFDRGRVGSGGFILFFC